MSLYIITIKQGAHTILRDGVEAATEAEASAHAKRIALGYKGAECSVIDASEVRQPWMSNPLSIKPVADGDDPRRIIATAETGRLICALDPDQKGKVALWVCADERSIRDWGATPSIEMRAGVLSEQYAGRMIGLVPIIVRIGVSIFETWIDPRASSVLEPLAGQTELEVHVFQPGEEANERARTLTAENGLRDFAKSAAPRVRALPAWKDDEFREARMSAGGRYQRPWGLWVALGR